MEMDGNPMFLIFGKVHCIVPYLIKKKTPFRPVLGNLSVRFAHFCCMGLLYA